MYHVQRHCTYVRFMPSSRIFVLLISSLSASSVVFCCHLRVAEEEISVDCSHNSSSVCFFVYVLPVDTSDTYSHRALTCCNRRGWFTYRYRFHLMFLCFLLTVGWRHKEKIRVSTLWCVTPQTVIIFLNFRRVISAWNNIKNKSCQNFTSIC